MSAKPSQSDASDRPGGPDLAALSDILARNPKARPTEILPDVPPSRLPRHIAIIMDGNGRWAKARGLAREFGHREGAKTVRAVVEECVRIGIPALTLYSFSMENWKRPPDEVEALMTLCHLYLEGERELMIREGIRFRAIGRLDGLPRPVREQLTHVTQATAHGRAMTLCLALNYGSRAELADAARSLAIDAAAGRINPEAIDEKLLASRLYTHDLPDPDLLVRTAGEMRISNFLLWQISYAELVVTQTYWPEFTAQSLHEAIRDYSRRSRRFGGLDSVTP